MKKILALFLAICMTFALVACGENGETTPTGESTGATEGSSGVGATNPTNPSANTPPATDPSATTPPASEPLATEPPATEPPATEPPATEPPATEPPATEPPATEPPATEPPHTHNYSAEVTTAATCMGTGIKTFTCSCGDSYTETIDAKGHFFGDWVIDTPAFIDKDGTRTKTCTVCSASKTAKSIENAMSNSFYDAGLPHIIGHNYGTLSGSSLLEYASFTFTEYADKPVAADTIFAALAKYFTITDDLKTSMKEYATQRFGYNAADDTITLHNYGISGMGTATLEGYVHNGGNEYSTYYTYSPFADVYVFFEIKLEYNRSNGEPNRYLSFQMVDTLPGDMDRE